MYSKSGARNAKHEWLSTADNIGSLSYVSIQVFKPVTGDTSQVSDIGGSTFAHVPATHLLFSLSSYTVNIQEVSTAKTRFTLAILDNAALPIFHEWTSVTQRVREAIKTMTSKSAKGAPAANDSEQEEED